DRTILFPYIQALVSLSEVSRRCSSDHAAREHDDNSGVWSPVQRLFSKVALAHFRCRRSGHFWRLSHSTVLSCHARFFSGQWGLFLASCFSRRTSWRGSGWLAGRKVPRSPAQG